MIRIYPSLISANLVNLDFEIQQLEPYVDGFHIDIMDNHFVPNLTWGPDMINTIATVTSKPLWIHLMVTDPLSIIECCSLAWHSMITIHAESNCNIEKTILRITEKNWLPGIAISPKTAPSEIKPFLHKIHHALPMSVVPGFAGQEFLPETIGIIDELNRYKKSVFAQATPDKQTTINNFIIMADGGINQSNIKLLYNHGVRDFAIASGIFSHKDPVAAIQRLREAINN